METKLPADLPQPTVFIGTPALDHAAWLTIYHVLNKVFSKTKDSSLLPHSLYNFALDFLPGLFLPEGHLYSLSTPKREAMDQYIKDFLGVGDRQHPMSLQRLLGTKKYHCKKLYPLTLLSSGLELFQGPSILEV